MQNYLNWKIDLEASGIQGWQDSSVVEYLL